MEPDPGPEPVRRMATRAMTQQKKMAEAAMETAEGNKEIDYFNSLPDELLILIFSYLPHAQLPTCSMVCRRWLRISSDESLWNRTNLRNAKIPLTCLAKLLQRGIRYLDMRTAEVFDPTPWNRCFSKKYRSKLEVLDTSYVEISSKGFAHLLRPCRKLLRLESVGNVHLDHPSCDAIGCNPDLRVLNLCETRGLDTRGLTVILSKCRKLEDINLNKANLSMDALNAMTANLSPSVTTLSLHNCGYHLQDNHVFEIVQRCPNLKFLNLSSNKHLTEAAFERARTLKHLEELVEDREAPWNYLDDDDDDDDDFFLEDSDEFYEDDYDFDFLHADSDDDDDMDFVHAMNMQLDDENIDLDDVGPHVDMDDTESDDDVVGIASDSDSATTSRESFFSHENTSSEEDSSSIDGSGDVVVDNDVEGNENSPEIDECSDELYDVGSAEDDVDIASFDGDDEFGSDEAGDDEDGDDEGDDYDDETDCGEDL